MTGILVSFWDCPFSGAMLVSGSVTGGPRTFFLRKLCLDIGKDFFQPQTSDAENDHVFPVKKLV